MKFALPILGGRTARLPLISKILKFNLKKKKNNNNSLNISFTQINDKLRNQLQI